MTILTIYLTIILVILGYSFSYRLVMSIIGLGMLLIVLSLKPSIRRTYKENISTILFLWGLLILIGTIFIVLYYDLSARFLLTSMGFGFGLLIISYLIPVSKNGEFENGEPALGIIKTMNQLDDDEDGFPQIQVILSVFKPDGTILDKEWICTARKFQEVMMVRSLTPGMALWLTVSADNQIELDQENRKFI